MSASYTVGDGKTYTVDIQDAIDDIPGDLSGQGKQWVQVYTAAAGYAGWLDGHGGFSNGTDGGDFIDIEAMVSHGGLRDQGIVIDVGDAAQTNHIWLYQYTRLHGFCITSSAWKAAAGNTIILAEWPAVNRTYIYDNLIYDCQCDADQALYAIYVTTNVISAYNNQIFNIGNTTGWAIGIYINVNGSAGEPHRIMNNVFHNIPNATYGYGINCDNKTYINCHNNYSDARVAFRALSGANCSITYNISADTTADDWGGDGNLISKAAANQFVSVSAGSEDLHLKSTADCFRNGADMSTYFTHDCVNIPRKFWRTGAFETLPTVYSVNDGNPHKVYYSWGSNLAKVDGVDVPLRNTESMTDNDDATIQVGQFDAALQFGGLIGDLKIFDQSDVKDTRP